LADALKQEPGVEVTLTDGKTGELTVLVDGHVVAKKGLLFKPSVEKVVKSVRAANSATTESKS
jgi:hypothetical protein